jgi:hypothetical protein
MAQNTRIPTLGAAVAAALLLAPAAASAAAPTLIAGPLKVKDYSMTVSATHGSSAVNVLFNRTAGKATQTHMYSFDSGATVKVKGAKGSLKADLGRFGAIKLKLKNVGAARKGSVPAGCTGTPGSARSGKLTGSFKLVADSTYFNTVSAKRLKAQVVKGGSLNCQGAGGQPDAPTTLMANLEQPGGQLTFYATRAADGGVAQQAMRIDDEAATAPASIMHLINAPGGAAAFAPASDLSGATGTGVGPFLTGAFSFAGEPFGTMASGKLSGDLVANFDSIGAQQIASGAPDAILMSR